MRTDLRNDVHIDGRTDEHPGLMSGLTSGSTSYQVALRIASHQQLRIAVAGLVEMTSIALPPTSWRLPTCASQSLWLIVPATVGCRCCSVAGCEVLLLHKP